MLAKYPKAVVYGPANEPIAEYYPGHPRYESDPSSPHSEYQPRDYGRTYDSRPYVPGYGLEGFFPSYDSAKHLWTGLNPFFMYGVGSPYLPQWWSSRPTSAFYRQCRPASLSFRW